MTAGKGGKKTLPKKQKANAHVGKKIHGSDVQDYVIFMLILMR